MSAADRQRYREARVNVAPIGFKPSDFACRDTGDRFTALAALHEGQRIAKDEGRSPNREGRCMGFANACLCATCSLPADQRRLRRKLGIPIDRKEAA